ncbi:hypothetical protein RJ640_030182 [Escallonia rubra]|uniref:Uncharacterized protein n=1 Tax=Escallonia rubra TaxID=112253 RepID=A0AA88QHF5_9ASTE|nr:hypothetical protein RJ640_030182 [Escallonia rubra]
MKITRPFPAGVILHAYLGSAEMVPKFTKLGALRMRLSTIFFSFSGFLMSMKENKAKKALNAVPSERKLLETDAPDALPNYIIWIHRSSKIRILQFEKSFVYIQKIYLLVMSVPLRDSLLVQGTNNTMGSDWV